jgi:hypothetical protein
VPWGGRRTCYAAGVVALAFLLVQILAFGYGRDQAIYAVVARSLLAGGMPYRDAWDFKPPGIFFVYAAARGLFGSAPIGIRILEVSGLAAMTAAMMGLARRFWDEPGIGLAAAVLAVLNHAQYDFWHTAQPESFGGMLGLFALAVLAPGDLVGVRPAAPSRAWRWAVCAALFGCCGLMKPPLAASALVLAAWIVARRRAAGAAWGRAVLPPLAAFAAGGALPFVVVLSWFAARGALPDLLDTMVRFAPHYTALSWEGASVAGMSWQGLREGLRSTSGPALLGLVLLLALPRRSVERRGVGLLWALAAVQMVGVVMQGKFFPYHYGALGPIVALLAALGWHAAWRRLAVRGGKGAALLVAGAAMATVAPWANHHYEDSFAARTGPRLRLIASGLRDERLADELATAFDVYAAPNRAVARYVRANVAPERAILVWGFEPVVYDLAERLAASRYIYDVPQRSAWSMAETQARMMRDLCRTPPAAIVVEHDDRMPWVTGSDADSAEALGQFPALSETLAHGYRLAQTISSFDVYVEAAGTSARPADCPGS